VDSLPSEKWRGSKNGNDIIMVILLIIDDEMNFKIEVIFTILSKYIALDSCIYSKVTNRSDEYNQISNII